MLPQLQKTQQLGPPREPGPDMDRPWPACRLGEEPLSQSGGDKGLSLPALPPGPGAGTSVSSGNSCRSGAPPRGLTNCSRRGAVPSPEKWVSESSVKGPQNVPKERRGLRRVEGRLSDHPMLTGPEHRQGPLVCSPTHHGVLLSTTGSNPQAQPDG